MTASLQSSAFNVSAGPANKLGFGQQPTNVAAGSSMTPAVTVQVQDQFGNAVSSSGVLITVAPSTGTINGVGNNTATTNGSGLASFGAISFNVAASNVTLTASATTPVLTSGPSTTFNVTPGAANKLVFLQGPSNVAAGVSMTSAVTVQVLDQFGNLVTGDTGRTITLTVSSGTIASGNTANSSAGVATFGAIKINTTATGLTLTGTASGLSSTLASTPFNVTPGPARALVFEDQTSNAVAGQPMTPSVSVQTTDAFGNVVASNGVVVTLTPSSGTIASGDTADHGLVGPGDLRRHHDQHRQPELDPDRRRSVVHQFGAVELVQRGRRDCQQAGVRARPRRTCR